MTTMSERKDADTSEAQLKTPMAITPNDIEEARIEKVQDDFQKTERRPGALGRELSELPPGYYRSVRFIGTFVAVSFGFFGAVAGFNLIAPLISAINNDLGPSLNAPWIATGYLVAQTMFFNVCGRLSDIFGRRWCLIVGSALATLGCILGGSAQSIGQVIAAETIQGIAAGFQVNFWWVLAETVPMRRRFIASTAIYIVSIPGNPFSILVAIKMQNNTSSHWRGCFYWMIGVNAVSTLCYYLFYHPPTFKMLYRTKTLRRILADFDYIGLLLFSLGLLLLVMGMQWGGVLYPWKSAHVIGALVGGFVGLVLFGLYEAFFCKFSEPYLPLHFFTNVPFQATAWITGINAIGYFAFTLIWPQAVTRLYSGLSPDYVAFLSGLTLMCFVFGQISGTFIANWVPPKPILIGALACGAPLLAAVAANPLNRHLTIGLLVPGILAIGMAEGVGIALNTFPLRTQEEIGTAGGLSGTIRAFSVAIGTVVYNTILNNRLSSTISSNVVPVMVDAHLPSSNFTTIITSLNNGLPLTGPESLVGLNAQLAGAIQAAYRVACADTYRTVFLSTLSFTGLTLILVWFAPNIDQSKAQYVATEIHQPQDEKALETE